MNNGCGKIALALMLISSAIVICSLLGSAACPIPYDLGPEPVYYLEPEPAPERRSKARSVPGAPAPDPNPGPPPCVQC